MVHACEFQSFHLDQLQYLINSHLGSLIPGWALPSEYIASCLERNPNEFVTDPWVCERKTLIAMKNDRVCAAAHILRYRKDSPAEGRGEIDWFVCWPKEVEAGQVILSTAVQQLDSWQTRAPLAGCNLPVPVFSGVPESWQHIIELFKRAGFTPGHDEAEAIYGGRLASVEPPEEVPLPGIAREMGEFGTRFVARLNNASVCCCECYTDLDQGGRLPAMTPWTELSEIATREDCRGQGIGTWVVKHAVQ